MMTDDEIADLVQSLEAGPQERAAARERLAALGEAVVDPLIAAVQEGMGHRAWVAAEILGELRSPRAFDVLVAALRAQHPLLGSAAVKALTHYDDGELVLHLVEALPHAHIMTQNSIILALQRLGDNRAVQVLVAQLPQTHSPTIRSAIVQTLGKLGDPAAIPAIRACANDPDRHVRDWVAIALIQLGGKSDAALHP